MRRVPALLAFLLLPLPAAADPSFDACVRKLCVSPNQMDCWVKAGTDLCNRVETQCRMLPDHAGALAKRKAGKRWEVRTLYGEGWVSERMMMVSADKC